MASGFTKNKVLWSRMAWQKLDSSMLDAVDYDDVLHVLHVRFNGRGEIYSFQEVPEDMYKGLMESTSKGAYFNKKIKGFRST